MSEIIQLAPPVRENPGAQLLRRDAPDIRTDAVYGVGGRPTPSGGAEDWRAAGHFVVFVDTAEHKETANA